MFYFVLTRKNNLWKMKESKSTSYQRLPEETSDKKNEIALKN